jgi:8-oxo-dGTP diphosphatase
MENPQSVTGAVFSSDRKSVLLILRRDVPVWVLPGGGIEPGEEPESAVLREILEETGFTVKVVRLVGAYTPINRLAKRTHLYECEVVSGKATTSSESKGVQFFPLNALPPLIPPPYPEWIQEAFSQSSFVERPLNGVTYWVLFKNLIAHPLLVIRFLLSRIGLTINT